MTTKSLAQRARHGLDSIDPGEFEEAVYAMSRLTDTEIFYDVVEKAPLETEVFIDKVKLRVAQLEAELAMHKAALLGAEQALEVYQQSIDPNAVDDAIARMDKIPAVEGVVVPMSDVKHLSH